MVLADASAWIEFLRGTGSPEALAIRRLIADGGGELATTGQVVMEVLDGAADVGERERLEGLLARARSLPARDPDDFAHAASIRSTLRANRRKVAQLGDCLIAAVALRTGAQVLHRDKHFDAIAELTGLPTVT